MVRLKEQYHCAVSAIPIYAEPGSPWVAFPEVFGLRQFSLTFEEFCEQWEKPLAGWNDDLTGMPSVQRVMDEIERRLRIDKLSET